MDQTPSDIEQDIRAIMQTRVAMARKMDGLRQEVRDQYESTRMSAMNMMQHAAETARDIVDQTRQSLGLLYHIDRRPWMMFGGAVAAGFLFGVWNARRSGAGIHPYYPPKAEGAPVMPAEADRSRETPGIYPYFPADPAPRRAARRRRTPLWDDLRDELLDEFERSKAVLVRVSREFARDMIGQIVPSLLQSLAPKSINRPPDVEAGMSRSSRRV